MISRYKKEAYLQSIEALQITIHSRIYPVVYSLSTSPVSPDKKGNMRHGDTRLYFDRVAAASHAVGFLLNMQSRIVQITNTPVDYVFKLAGQYDLSKSVAEMISIFLAGGKPDIASYCFWCGDKIEGKPRLTLGFVVCSRDCSVSLRAHFDSMDSDRFYRLYGPAAADRKTTVEKISIGKRGRLPKP